MTIKNTMFSGFLLLCQFVCAQQDSIALDEVIIGDRQLREFSGTQAVLTLNDSVIAANRASLASLLNYNSVIYFKENGPGMVASPSFRGTTAQQSVVVWNGLNINSHFNGQTDFNAISATDFESVSVRSGGGSVIYGSSAIGGSIHLNNELAFDDRVTHHLNANYGSFNTFSANYKGHAASKNVAAQISLSRNLSDNDFTIPGSDRENLNGEYENTGMNLSLGFKIDSANSLKIIGYGYEGTRHFSLISPTDTKTKYTDQNARLLAQWSNVTGRLSSKLTTAYLNERYDFFDNLSNPASNKGDARTLIAKYDGLYTIDSKMTVNAIADVTQTHATGTDVGNKIRDIASFAFLFKHRPTAIIRYEIGVRREITKSYDSPILFSVGGQLRFSPIYTLKIHGSKNFRIPTFNDMYWLGGGNAELRPETALQGEIGNVLTFGNWQFTATGYYISITDMIQWLPGTTTLWNPVNVNRVMTYGFENAVEWNKQVGTHRLAASGNYAYTLSKNTQTDDQLIYVPIHKATGSLAYSWRKISADFQIIYCGEVFTRSDNDPRYVVDAYIVSNFGVGYAFGKKSVVKIGARILNALDEKYQAVAGRPFPGRNYNLFLNFKF